MRDLTDMEKTYEEAKKLADSVVGADRHPFDYKNDAPPRHFNFADTGKNLNDPVNKPAHYSLNHKGIEAIQAIEAALTPEEFRGFLKGNILKYTWREKYKNGLEDNKKAVWYANKLVTITEGTK